MQPSAQTTSARDGRIAGALYLVSLPVGLVRAVYVQNTLLAGSFAADHAAATAQHIVANEMTFRLAMLADIAIHPTQGDSVESEGWSGTRIIIGKLTEAPRLSPDTRDTLETRRAGERS